MPKDEIFDLIGIGIGPFNLGMAALASSLPLKAVFFDRTEKFSWHPGLLLDHSLLQVPFFADLVTLADPCNPFSFLAWLKSRGALMRFAYSERLYAYRKEYNQYCQWVASRLENLQFGREVIQVSYDKTGEVYKVLVREKENARITAWRARHLVIGIGTCPSLPDFVSSLGQKLVFHSSDYLFRKSELLACQSIVLVGSGQSAAEIFYDLLPMEKDFEGGLRWFTGADRWFSMEGSKLCYEMSSPAYIDFFFHLPADQKARILGAQDSLYKGINQQLLGDIYELMYQLSLDRAGLNVDIRSGCQLKGASPGEGRWMNLQFYHRALCRDFQIECEAMILATGYRPSEPWFLEGIRDRIRRDEKGKYAVNGNYAVDSTGKGVFVQNAELHSHGFNAPDLGLGAYRNARILNTILGETHFSLEFLPCFQSFEGPGLEPDILSAGMKRQGFTVPDKSSG